MNSPLRLVALSILAALATILPGAVLIWVIGGDWSLARFALWCFGMAPISAATHHRFRLDEHGISLLQTDWRQLKQGLVMLSIALVTGFLIEEGVPIMPLTAVAGTVVAYAILDFALPRRPPNTSLERTRAR